MNLKHFAPFICAVLMYAQSTAQPVIEAQRTVGGTANDNFSSMALTGDGGLVGGGTSYSGISGQKKDTSRGGGDYWIVKYDKQGHRRWDKTVGGNKDDLLNDIQPTSDGGVILGGTTRSDKSGEKSEDRKGTSDFWIVKLDSEGNIEWDKDFGLGDGFYYDHEFTSMQQTSDGGYVIAGSLLAWNDDIFTDFILLKLDSSGNTQWYKIAAGANRLKVKQTANNGYILGGTSYSGVSFSDYYSVFKYDSLGNKQWSHYYKIDGASSVLYAILPTGDGYILGGYSNAYKQEGIKSEESRGGFDYWLMAIDGTGNYVWDKTIGGSSSDYLRSMESTADGGLILGGYSGSNTSGEKTENSRGLADYWIVKLDSQRNVQWDKTIGGAANDYLYSVKEFEPNRYVSGGYSSSGESGDKMQSSMGGTDYWGVILSSITPATVTNKVVHQDAQDIKAFTAYPNPARDKITIQSKGTATFILTSQQGKTILTKMIVNMGAIDVGNVPSGIYFLTNSTTGMSQRIVVSR